MASAMYIRMHTSLMVYRQSGRLTRLRYYCLLSRVAFIWLELGVCRRCWIDVLDSSVNSELRRRSINYSNNSHGCPL